MKKTLWEGSRSTLLRWWKKWTTLVFTNQSEDEMLWFESYFTFGSLITSLNSISAELLINETVALKRLSVDRYFKLLSTLDSSESVGEQNQHWTKNDTKNVIGKNYVNRFVVQIYFESVIGLYICFKIKVRHSLRILKNNEMKKKKKSWTNLNKQKVGQQFRNWKPENPNFIPNYLESFGNF